MKRKKKKIFFCKQKKVRCPNHTFHPEIDCKKNSELISGTMFILQLYLDCIIVINSIFKDTFQEANTDTKNVSDTFSNTF